ncbi:MAG: RDD family protein [Myxococcales bacterium]
MSDVNDSSKQVSGGPFGRFFSARPEGSRYPKAELLPRLLARLTDLVIAAFLPVAADKAGWILAVLFILFADGMLKGQSPGKKALGIKVVRLPNGEDIDYRESALRNFPFALVLLAPLLPVAGQFLFWTAGPTLLLFESWRVFRDKLGLRMGDLFASTQVIDTKVPVGAISRPKLELVRPEPGRVRGAVRVLLEPPKFEPPGAP